MGKANFGGRLFDRCLKAHNVRTGFSVLPCGDAVFATLHKKTTTKTNKQTKNTEESHKKLRASKKPQDNGVKFYHHCHKQFVYLSSIPSTSKSLGLKFPCFLWSTEACLFRRGMETTSDDPGDYPRLEDPPQHQSGRVEEKRNQKKGKGKNSLEWFWTAIRSKCCGWERRSILSLLLVTRKMSKRVLRDKTRK